ncbi:uncharacterized protein Tco025E_00328 [Trypanosoma conorhini]|uniref:Uncharacterized protein n=1 Tax=Trypanosoma conorhini TaxID=83891 RepID=A0A3R7LM66_9TRYP|nr:uncharacterized protein Tco025E_00328 [Trypanosoma conorhini]RNF27398.1 hypothetical protein Tco025E_00328 [Trypanosoma conorhini]
MAQQVRPPGPGLWYPPPQPQQTQLQQTPPPTPRQQPPPPPSPQQLPQPRMSLGPQWQAMNGAPPSVGMQSSYPPPYMPSQAMLLQVSSSSSSSSSSLPCFHSRSSVHRRRGGCRRTCRGTISRVAVRKWVVALPASLDSAVAAEPRVAAVSATPAQ